MATLDRYGVCLISELNTDKYLSHITVKTSYGLDRFGRCRWSTNIDEPLVYIKYDNELKVLDTVKNALIPKKKIELDAGK